MHGAYIRRNSALWINLPEKIQNALLRKIHFTAKIDAHEVVGRTHKWRERFTGVKLNIQSLKLRIHHVI